MRLAANLRGGPAVCVSLVSSPGSLLGVLGFGVKVAHVPERWFPGRCDTVGASHQLWCALPPRPSSPAARGLLLATPTPAQPLGAPGLQGFRLDICHPPMYLWITDVASEATARAPPHAPSLSQSAARHRNVVLPRVFVSRCVLPSRAGRRLRLRRHMLTIAGPLVCLAANARLLEFRLDIACPEY